MVVDPTKLHDLKPVSVVEITKPGATSSHMVLRNGSYYKVTVKERTYLETMPDGHVRGRTVEEGPDAAELAKLPAIDPSSTRVPTQDEIVTAAKEIGVDILPDGTPGPPPPPPGATPSGKQVPMQVNRAN